MTTKAKPLALVATSLLAASAMLPAAPLKQLVNPASASQAGAADFSGWGGAALHPNVVNNSGLSGAATFANYTTITHTAAGPGNAWTTEAPGADYFAAGGPPAVWTISLAQVESLTDLVFWGYHFNNPNGNESRSFTVEFSADGGSTFPSSANVSIPLGQHAVSDPKTLSFGGSFAADVVKITITDNQAGGGAAGGDRLGVGEFKFLGELPPRDPEIDPNPTSVNIDSDGSPVPVTIDVTNNGGSNTLNISAVTPGGTNAAFITNLVFPPTVGPGATGQITFDVDPAGATGTIDAEIVIASDDSLVPTCPIAITGTIRDPKIDTLATVNLGTFNPGDPAQPFTVDVNNLGASQNLVVSGGSLATATAFTLDDDLGTTNLVVIPAGTGQVNLTFTPGGVPGNFSDTLELVSNDPVQSSTFITLEASVVRDPEISVPAVVNLGPFPAASGPHAFSVSVDNLGAAQALTLAPDPSVSGGDAALFSVDTFDASIAAAGSGSVNLTFDPAGAIGAFSTTLQIDSNDLLEPSATVQLNASVSPPVLPGGLVAWWPLHDGANPGIDATGNGFDGVLTGAVSQCPGANGATGNSMEFDGSDVINVPWSPFLNPDSFTVTLWANPSVAGGTHRSPITSRDDAPGSTHGYIAYIEPGGTWQFWTGDGNPGWDVLGDGPAAASTWTHLAIVYDAGTETKKIYVNGGEAGTRTAAGLYVPNGPQQEALHIGGGADDGNSFRFVGKIDDVAVFNSALSLGDINSIMDNGVGAFAFTAFEAYVANAGLVGADALPGADPDGDDLTNLEELGQGTDPAVSDNAPLVLTDPTSFTPGAAITNVETGGGGVVFTLQFVQRVDGAVDYSVEFSGNLIDWEPSSDVPSVLSDDGSGYQVVSISYPYFLASGRKARFFRIVYTLN